MNPIMIDKLFEAVAWLPDVTHTKPSTVVAVLSLIGEAQIWRIQTYRQHDVGDTIFLHCLDGQNQVRVAIPPAAAEAIARQRDALTTKVRRRKSKQ